MYTNGETQSLRGGESRVYLELGRLHGDWDADEEDAEHGDGGVAAPMDGAAVWPARHAPHLLAEVACPVPTAMVAAHRRRCAAAGSTPSIYSDRGVRSGCRAVTRADGSDGGENWGIALSTAFLR